MNLTQGSKSVEKKIFPHVLAVFLWALLILIAALNLNVSVAVTGAVADGGLKVIMLFNVLMLFFSLIEFLTFSRIRKEGVPERLINAFSVSALLFSIVNISLHFIDDFALLMKATEVVAWGLFSTTFPISMYRILVWFLMPLFEENAR